LRYWNDTWRRGTSHQEVGTQNSGRGHWTRVAPDGRDGSAKRNWADMSTGRRLVPGGGGCLPDGRELNFAQRCGGGATRFHVQIWIALRVLHNF